MKAQEKYKIIFHFKDENSLSDDQRAIIVKKIKDFYKDSLVIFGDVDIHILEK